MDEREFLLKPRPPQLSLKKEQEKKEKQKKLEKKLKIREERKEEVFLVVEENQNRFLINTFIQWLLKKTSSNKKNQKNDHAPKMIARPTINQIQNPSPVISPTPFNTRLTPQLKIAKDKELAAKKLQQEKEVEKLKALKKDLVEKLKQQNKKPAPTPQALKPSVKTQNPFLKAAQQRAKHSSYTKDNGHELMHVSRMEIGG